LSAFRLSPLASPVLLAGTLTAFSLHMLAMHLPPMQRILGVAPVEWKTFAGLLALAMSIVLAMEAHKWLWKSRSTRR